jgi:hypothetical protein
MEGFVDGWSTRCLIADVVECAEDAGPGRNTHGDFIDRRWKRKEDSQLRSYLDLTV